jgi:hypothetical protein
MEIQHEHPIYSSDAQQTEAMADAVARILEILEIVDAN